VDFKGTIPAVAGSKENGISSQGADEGETEGTTNKSGLNLEEDVGMGLECDGQQCYPKFF